MKRIIVIDDEHDLCEILRVNLELAGYEVSIAHSAEEALRLDLATHDLLLLDVMMDGMSGFELAEYLRHKPETARLPIIFITAKDTEEDLLRGFTLGADAYITKPCSLREMLARVKAVLARTTSSSMLTHKGLVMDIEHQTVSTDGKKVMLTKTEFDLLHLLMRERGHVLSRTQLIEGAWPLGVVVTDRAVDVNITRLRKKMGDYAHHIIARHGFGYCFDA
jgi:DNA-binding response OmpR family regulator